MVRSMAASSISRGELGQESQSLRAMQEVWRMTGPHPRKAEMWRPAWRLAGSRHARGVISQSPSFWGFENGVVLSTASSFAEHSSEDRSDWLSSYANRPGNSDFLQGILCAAVLARTQHRRFFCILLKRSSGRH